MLMTRDELTALQDAILIVLTEASKPMSRSEIAEAIGRPNRLVPHDIDMLESLVDMGLVLKTEVKIGTVKTVMKYQVAH